MQTPFQRWYTLDQEGNEVKWSWIWDPLKCLWDLGRSGYGIKGTLHPSLIEIHLTTTTFVTRPVTPGTWAHFELLNKVYVDKTNFYHLFFFQRSLMIWVGVRQVRTDPPKEPYLCLSLQILSKSDIRVVTNKILILCFFWA